MHVMQIKMKLGTSRNRADSGPRPSARPQNGLAHSHHIKAYRPVEEGTKPNTVGYAGQFILPCKLLVEFNAQLAPYLNGHMLKL